MATPMNSMASTSTAVIQCSSRDRIGKDGDIVIVLANLHCAWRLGLAGASCEGHRIGSRPRRQQRIVRGLEAGRQHERIEVDVAAVAGGLGLERRDAERSG